MKLMFDWNQDARPGETTYAIGDLLLSVLSRPGTPPQPLLRVTGPGSDAYAVAGEPGLSTAQAKLGVSPDLSLFAFHLSWPGATRYTSPGLTSPSVPSSCSTWGLPETT